uniref:DIX domain-containing protein n=1 Tax=Ciona savignyi TaxID=51511 RepID=H2YPR1_CIOSA
MSPISPTPRSPILSRAGDKLARRSPLSRNHPSRRRKTMDNQMTRVLYFTDRDMTPCMTSIPKRVGDITLGEFKAAIRKEGNFRFIFKALDPELGTVKEEVFHNDDVIPGWEGKIVAWVEEVLRV